MRIALLSDIHGNLPALQACWAHLQRQGGAELVVNCGDILSGPLWPAETADWLLESNWLTIAGNHERQALACGHQPSKPHGRSDVFAFERMRPDHRRWFAALPGTLDLTAHGAPGVMVCHGQPAVDYEYLLETLGPGGSRMATAAEVSERLAAPAALPAFAQASLVVCGHSHLPRAIQTQSAQGLGPLCVNPGSVGLPAFDDDHRHVHVHQTGTPHARYAVCERADANAAWQVSFFNVAYDWQAAADKAAREGFAPWARWLATGFA